jgi:hypothetical protein
MSDSLLTILEMIEEALEEQSEFPQIEDEEVIQIVKGIEGVDGEKLNPIPGDRSIRLTVPAGDRERVTAEILQILQNKYPDLTYYLHKDSNGLPRAGVAVRFGKRGSKVKDVFIKPIRGSGISNIGDVSEGLLGAALFARFANYDKDITDGDVKQFLTELKEAKTRIKPETDPRTRSDKIIEKTLRVPRNREDGTTDNYTYILRLGIINYRDLVSEQKRGALASEIKSVAAYVNSDEVREAARLVATNKQNNEVAIITDGVTGQKSTKVDLKTYLDGTIMKSIGQISLKARSTDQLGQRGGSWLATEKLFKQMFGVELNPSFEQQWNQTLTKENKRSPEGMALITNLVNQIYQSAADQINKNLAAGGKSNPEEDVDFIERISKGLKYEAALEQEGVIVIQLSKGDFYRLDFSKLEDNIRKAGIEFVAQMSPSTKRPTLLMMDKNSNETLFQIRFRFDSGGVRQYIEKGPLATKLLTASEET